MSERKKRGTAADKTICLPIAEEIDYEQLVKDTAEFRAYLDHQIAEHPDAGKQNQNAAHRQCEPASEITTATIKHLDSSGIPCHKSFLTSRTLPQPATADVNVVPEP
ncbi:MAG: hypothetical protein OHK0047_09550 [Leptolyngbyaceae cyanobacterium]